MALRGGTRFSVRCEDMFPAGCALVPESMGEMEDYDEKTGRRTPGAAVRGSMINDVR